MTRRPGFTLIELIAVLLIMALALGAIAPQLRGWSETGRLRDSMQSLQAATTWARSRAVADAVTYRLLIDTATGSYLVRQVADNQATEISGEFGRKTAMPTGFKIDVEGEGGTSIDFTPDGRTTPATITITSSSGATMQLACLSPAETFAIVKDPKKTP